MHSSSCPASNSNTSSAATRGMILDLMPSSQSIIDPSLQANNNYSLLGQHRIFSFHLYLK